MRKRYRGYLPHYGRISNPKRASDVPDVEQALQDLPPGVAPAYRAGVRALQERGVSFALCGGVALRAYGADAMTSDVDFLVGEDAFFGRIIKQTVEGLPHQHGTTAIDYVPVVNPDPTLARVLPNVVAVSPDSVPVVPLDVLVLMKLRANRGKDRNAIRTLLVNLPDARTHAMQRWMRDNGAPDVADTIQRLWDGI